MFSKINDVVHSAVIDTLESDEIARQCVTQIVQALELNILNSKIQVSGDFIVRQKAKYALACIQGAVNKEQLVTKLKERVVEGVKTALLSQQISIDAKRVSDAVDPKIDALVRQCAYEKARNSGGGRTGLVESVGIDIIGSKLTVGCSDEDLKRNADECVAQSARGVLDHPSCRFVVDCAKKEGNLTIDASALQQPPSTTSACDQLPQVAQSIAVELARQSAKPSSESGVKIAQAPSVWKTALIILGSLLVLLLLILVAYFVSRLVKQSNAVKKKKVQKDTSSRLF